MAARTQGVQDQANHVVAKRGAAGASRYQGRDDAEDLGQASIAMRDPTVGRGASRALMQTPSASQTAMRSSIAAHPRRVGVAHGETPLSAQKPEDVDQHEAQDPDQHETEDLDQHDLDAQDLDDSDEETWVSSTTSAPAWRAPAAGLPAPSRSPPPVTARPAAPPATAADGARLLVARRPLALSLAPSRCAGSIFGGSAAPSAGGDEGV